MGYTFGQTFAIKSGADPEAVTKELLRLAKKHKCLTPRIVLAAARDPNNPLHAAFDWDDAEAAEKWRLHQARELIRTIRVEMPDQKPINVFVHVSQQDGYQPIEQVVSAPDLFYKAMSEALQGVRAAQQRVEALERAARERVEDGRMERDQLAKIVIMARALETAAGVAKTLH